jgi:hypothetical protein
MLSDKAYRELVVANVKDPGVRAFWVDEFAKYNERYMQEAGDAIKNKIGQFTSNPIIRNIIGQPHSSFDIRKMMDEKKILIMNLSKGLIGESNANLLGSMLTTRIYLAAMSRADLPPEKMREMPNFYFYVDEFQSFANATFANILSEARKYHLNLTIAHQYIEQMEEEVRNAVFGNVGTIIAFRVGPFDAETLEPIFAPQFMATDIVNLSFAQIYLTLMIDGIGSQPFSATTLPPIAPPASSCKDMAIAGSRAMFTRPRAEVEEMIHKFHEPVVSPKKQRDENRPDKNSRPSQQTSSHPNQSEEARAPHREAKRSEDNTLAPRTPRADKKEDVRPQEQKSMQQSSARTQERAVRNGDARPSKVTERPKTQSPDDLRAILKKIATKESSESPKESTPREQKKEVEKPERTDLKDALKTLLKDRQEAQPAKESAPTQESKKDVPKEDQKAPEHNVNNAPHEKPADSAVSPKELERMMRVTTNDKPPV